MSALRLYLDDYRPCPEGWTLAKSVSEAVGVVESALKRGDEWIAASLDHDLAEEHYLITSYGAPPQTGTGLDFVDWMIAQNCWPTVKPRVHSMNPSGAKRMRDAIDRYFPSIANAAENAIGGPR